MDPARFEEKVHSAIERARVVLESAKRPCVASDVHHQYEDKYLLAEHLTNAAAASQLNALANLHVTPEQLAKMREWAQASAVSLCFRSEERCTFLREETRDEENPTRTEHSLSVGGAVTRALTSMMITKITEYVWQFEVTWTLTAVRGVGAEPADRLELLTRTGRSELKTTVKQAPRSDQVPALKKEVQISWLFKQLKQEDAAPCFKVNRGHSLCHTPRRNPDVDGAMAHFGNFARWSGEVAKYLENFFSVETEANKMDKQSGSKALALHARAETFFIPVLPLMFEEIDGQEEEAVRVLGPAEANKLLAEEARTLAERRKDLAQVFGQAAGIAALQEAELSMELRHCAHVCEHWSSGLDYVEGLLRKQLVAAIGKEVQPADFAEYMRFHNRKLFAEAYCPIPFCFAVRRSSQHAPEGTVSIEQQPMGSGGDSPLPEPIFTCVARGTRPHTMQLPLSASTTVRFNGERYLHAWLSHKFSTQAAEKLQLVSRARQFSSMLVVVGRIASATAFEPKYAAIVKNKDELTIPLDLSTIPTPKEFKDAIESLSPEQQAFAKAFRSMQLESTLFGVMVIQIKPQLEKVLNLHPDSLTKEIKLTQELMELFIKYQIPSDLLSYDPEAGGAEVVGGASASERLEAVKAHVKAMNEMIQKSKEEELGDRRMEARFAAADRLAECEEMERCVQQDIDELMLGVQSLKETSCEVGCGLPKTRSRGGGGGMMRMMGMPMKKKANASQAERRSLAMPTSMSVVQSAPASAAAAGPAPPVTQPAQQAQPQQPQRPQEGPSSEESPEVDYTQVPKEMDKRFERLDIDGALRPTIITPGDTWTRRAQKALLASPENQTLGSTEQKQEKDAAFDLLDALTKSGGLEVDDASLHIVIAATHCFDKNVTDTVVQDNINPIDKVERSTLIMATTVHSQPPQALIREAQCPRVRNASPMLFIEDL